MSQGETTPLFPSELSFSADPAEYKERLIDARETFKKNTGQKNKN
jgi:hypothetical protein